MTALLQAAVGAVLIASAVAKLRSREQVRSFLTQLRVPVAVVSRVAPAVVPVELLIGTCLLLGLAPLPTAVVACVLSTAFVVIQVAAATRDVGPCRCFGSLGSLDNKPVELVRALILLAAAYVVVFTTDNAAVASPYAFGSRVAGVAAGLGLVVVSALVSGISWSRRTANVPLGDPAPAGASS